MRKKIDDRHLKKFVSKMYEHLRPGLSIRPQERPGAWDLTGMLDGIINFGVELDFDAGLRPMTD